MGEKGGKEKNKETVNKFIQTETDFIMKTKSKKCIKEMHDMIRKCSKKRSEMENYKVMAIRDIYFKVSDYRCRNYDSMSSTIQKFIGDLRKEQNKKSELVK